jgi:hypothetical protein
VAHSGSRKINRNRKSKPKVQTVTPQAKPEPQVETETPSSEIDDGVTIWTCGFDFPPFQSNFTHATNLQPPHTPINRKGPEITTRQNATAFY